METLKFECLGPKCPDTCCSGLRMILYQEASLAFSLPVIGTLWNGKLNHLMMPNRILPVTESQKKSTIYYPPLFVARTRLGIGYYGSQMPWIHGSCINLKEGMCSQYENRPYECRAAPFTLEGEKFVTMRGCPALKDATPTTRITTTVEYKKAAKLVSIINQVLFNMFRKDGVKELYFVYPETTKLPGFYPDYEVKLDIKDNKLIIDRKKE